MSQWTDTSSFSADIINMLISSLLKCSFFHNTRWTKWRIGQSQNFPFSELPFMEQQIIDMSSFDDVSKNLLTCTFHQVCHMPSILGKLQDVQNEESGDRGGWIQTKQKTCHVTNQKNIQKCPIKSTNTNTTTCPFSHCFDTDLVSVWQLFLRPLWEN